MTTSTYISCSTCGGFVGGKGYPRYTNDYWCRCASDSLLPSKEETNSNKLDKSLITMETEKSELKISIEEKDLLSEFMYGMKGLFLTKITWNDLIPIVEKIENELLLQVSIHTAYTNICGEINGIKYNQDSCFEAQEETKLIVTYRAVLRFIKWLQQWRVK